MKRHLQLGFAFLIALALMPVARGQEVSLSIEPRVFRLTEAATLTLTFRDIDNPPVPELSDIPGFQIQYVGRQQQMSVVNGVMEGSVSFRYRLTPTRTGTFTIGPFGMDLNGQTLTVNPVEVEVVGASGSPSSSAESSPPQQLNELVYAKLRTEPAEVYAYQQVTVYLDLYVRGVELDRAISLNDLPDSGLDLQPFEELRPTREAVGSEVYDVRHFRATAIPLASGTFDLAPTLRVNVVVPSQARRSARDPFDLFFQRRETRSVAVAVESWTLTVKPIPEDGRPATFSGAVGMFDFTVSLSRNDVTVGDPITLTARIEGQGNLDTIAMPNLQLDERFRVYDPKLVQQAGRGAGRGLKVFEQVVIPRSDDITGIPPVSFTFFDPAQETYRTVTRGPFPLTVAPSTQEGRTVVQLDDPVSPAVRKALGIDIVFLKNAPARWTADQDHGASAGWLHVFPVLAVIGALVWRRRADALSRDPGKARRLQAPKAARASLAEAERNLDDPVAFYTATWRALALYFAHRLNCEEGRISPELIRTAARRCRLPDDLTASLDALLTADEHLRFGAAPANRREEREAQARDLATLLRQFDRYKGDLG